MQQLECESNSITCMSCLYVHVYGNKVIFFFRRQDNSLKGQMKSQVGTIGHISETIN